MPRPLSREELQSQPGLIHISHSSRVRTCVVPDVALRVRTLKNTLGNELGTHNNNNSAEL